MLTTVVIFNQIKKNSLPVLTYIVTNSVCDSWKHTVVMCIHTVVMCINTVVLCIHTVVLCIQTYKHTFVMCIHTVVTCLHTLINTKTLLHEMDGKYCLI